MNSFLLKFIGFLPNYINFLIIWFWIAFWLLRKTKPVKLKNRTEWHLTNSQAFTYKINESSNISHIISGVGENTSRCNYIKESDIFDIGLSFNMQEIGAKFIDRNFQNALINPNYRSREFIIFRRLLLDQ